ncbi:hypothetical protein [Sphingomonas tagetis]|uniref:hypothetical protein n=1 Tax=Sphingomonas tagetis TaxID=2949092 RepID=UPI0020B7FA4F|nr:hypothetical protein [Sphingomonas tagetis]
MLIDELFLVHPTLGGTGCVTPIDCTKRDSHKRFFATQQKMLRAMIGKCPAERRGFEK